ncbi:MAG: transporter substrate-binding domain-containing protein [Solobacterium sp.]|nr:transporter substrate-binding domain-containing protein [Solobacterium sp.]
MKKVLSIILAALTAASLAGCSGGSADNSTAEPAKETATPAASAETASNALQKVKDRGYLVIGTEGNWSPWTYHDEKTDELTGFDVEVGKEIADYLGVEARFEEAAWESLLAGVQAGRFDIVCNGVGYTEERALSYEFSDPYVYTRKVLIVAADNDEIKTFEDLDGKTTANSTGSTYAEIAESYGATVTYIDTFGETITLLTQGRIDATINSEVSYLDYMSQHPEAPIKIVDQSEGESVCYPVNKGETELRDAVNEALESLRSSGKLAELSEKYFGGDITNK